MRDCLDQVVMYSKNNSGLKTEPCGTPAPIFIFFHKGIYLWENLEEHKRNHNTIASFKAHLKRDYPKRNILYYYGRR